MSCKPLRQHGLPSRQPIVVVNYARELKTPSDAMCSRHGTRLGLELVHDLKDHAGSM